MKLFFEQVLDEAFENIQLEKTYFVIPNQRSKIFLKKQILKKISSVSISPNILSIDDFIEKIADVKESPRTNQLFYLYESYMKVSKKVDFESYSLFLKIFMRYINWNLLLTRRQRKYLPFGVCFLK